MVGFRVIRIWPLNMKEMDKKTSLSEVFIDAKIMSKYEDVDFEKDNEQVHGGEDLKWKWGIVV